MTLDKIEVTFDRASNLKPEMFSSSLSFRGWKPPTLVEEYVDAR